MANICISNYRIAGVPSELDTLHSLILKIGDEKGRAVRHIVEAVNGSVPSDLSVRGEWSNLNKEVDSISFDEQSAYAPLYEAWDLICSKFKTLKVYFAAEEADDQLFIKRDNPDKGWFTYNYYVDACTPDEEYILEYFDTREEAFRYISELTYKDIISEEDIEEADEEWREENEDSYLNFYEFERV